MFAFRLEEAVEDRRAESVVRRAAALEPSSEALSVVASEGPWAFRLDFSEDRFSSEAETAVAEAVAAVGAVAGVVVGDVAAAFAACAARSAVIA